MAYKYSCRKCPIRNRCIEESVYTESVKNMIHHAFSGRTDTLSTWGLLQVNCLLVKAEEEQAKRAREGSALSRRLREARTARQQEVQTQKKTTPKTRSSSLRRLSQHKGTNEVTRPSTGQADEPPDYLRPVSTASPRQTGGLSSEEAIPQTASAPGITDKGTGATNHPDTAINQKPSWLTVSGSGRHIALPVKGEIVLGRFDATFGIPPDIDLAYEDRDENSVSRRHTKIIGRNGHHTVEDTGSRLGVFVNRRQITPGLSRQLKPGDTIAVGSVRMFYDEVPTHLRDISDEAAAHHFLIVTPTWRKLEIFPPANLVIGRSDRYLDFIPNIDLREDGQAAARVSRRHAIIHWKKNKPYVEDLGSGFGTRINGEMMLIGQAIPLKPGDHIWLGGCVLAYDVDI